MLMWFLGKGMGLFLRGTSQSRHKDRLTEKFPDFHFYGEIYAKIRFFATKVANVGVSLDFW